MTNFRKSYLSKSVTKLTDMGILSFGLPAGVTCPGGGKCRVWCYGLQGRYVCPNVRDARERNFDLARSPYFVGRIVDEIRRRSERIVRPHDSGDFFSQEYCDAWEEIATACPGVRFYAYTKSLHLTMPKSFHVIQSYGGKYDGRIDTSRPHSKVFATHYARRMAGYGDGSRTETLALSGAVKIGLVYHGTRKVKKGDLR